MSNATTEKTERPSIVVSPWGIEADHPRNSDLLLQCIPGARLRSAIRGSKGHTDVKTGDIVVPVDQARFLAGCPPLPGMQLHVNPAKLSYVIIDPLTDDPMLCERLTKFLSQSTPHRSTTTVKGVPEQKGTLDVHRMKTLCREMVALVTSGEARVVKGTAPDKDDIEELPGHFLLNPGCRVPNTQPTYEKDWDDWVAALSHSGG